MPRRRCWPARWPARCGHSDRKVLSVSLRTDVRAAKCIMSKHRIRHLAAMDGAMALGTSSPP